MSTSRSSTPATSGRKALKNSFVCPGVLYIFQLPAMSGRLPAVVAAVVGSMSASTPGSARPSRNSMEAPPPVDTWVRRPSRPKVRTADTVSPPPATVTATPPAMASPMARVPAANSVISNRPIGPFQ